MTQAEGRVLPRRLSFLLCQVESGVLTLQAAVRLREECPWRPQDAGRMWPFPGSPHGGPWAFPPSSQPGPPRPSRDPPAAGSDQFLPMPSSRPGKSCARGCLEDSGARVPQSRSFLGCENWMDEGGLAAMGGDARGTVEGPHLKRVALPPDCLPGCTTRGGDEVTCQFSSSLRPCIPESSGRVTTTRHPSTGCQAHSRCQLSANVLRECCPKPPGGVRSDPRLPTPNPLPSPPSRCCPPPQKRHPYLLFSSNWLIEPRKVGSLVAQRKKWLKAPTCQQLQDFNDPRRGSAPAAHAWAWGRPQVSQEPLSRS